MATLRSGGPGPAAAAPASAMEDAGNRWVPHGTVLTACVVGINVLVILLIFFFFWRFFSGKQDPSASSSAGGEDEDDDALPVASPWATRRSWRSAPRQAPPREDVVKSLPVYVYSSSSAGAGGNGKPVAVECAVCIVELKDGDATRRLPQCGHRFHADCVGAWLRLHATCPICRASVVAPVNASASASAAADVGPMNAKDAAVGADCPV